MIVNGSLPATFPLVFENLLAQSGGEGGGVRGERGRAMVRVVLVETMGMAMKRVRQMWCE